jgi:predicted MFS family arabinose efflux permease
VSASADTARPASLVRQRPIAALLAAEVISTTGSQMTWLALPWFVLLTTGSATRMTLVVAAELLGIGLLGLPGGKLLGRLGAWRTMLLCDGVRGPLMLLVPILHWSGALSFGALVAVAFGLGALSAPYFAAQRVIVPELLGEDEMQVSRASALFQGATRVTMLLGPVVGGLLIASLSAPAVLVVDAATYFVAVALIGLLVPRPQPLAEEGAEGRGIRDGFRFLAREPLLRLWTPIFSLGDAAWAAFFVSVPVLVVARFDADPRVAGWLLASFGVGAVAGNVVAFRLLGRIEGMSVIAACVMGQALPLWLLTVDLPAWAYCAALAMSGLANGLVNPSIHAFLTLRVPPALRPTVMTTMVMIFGLTQPIGVLGAGPVLDAFGVEPVLVAFAAVQTAMMTLIAVTAAKARQAPVTAAEPA